MTTLQIVQTAYRATSEEQDDTIVWLTHAMRGAGAELAVLLKGNAVNYAVAAQQSPPLVFGAWRQTQPPRLATDLQSLQAKGVEVFAVREDLAERGITESMLIGSVGLVARERLGDFVARFPRVWNW